MERITNWQPHIQTLLLERRKDALQKNTVLWSYKKWKDCLWKNAGRIVHDWFWATWSNIKGFTSSASDESCWVWPGLPICMQGRACSPFCRARVWFPQRSSLGHGGKTKLWTVSDLYLLMLHSDTMWCLEADKACCYTGGVRGQESQNTQLARRNKYLISSRVLM